MEQRYTALRTIAAIYRILGIIIAAVTVLALIGVCVATIAGATGGMRMMQELGIPRGANVVGGAVGALISGIIMIFYGGGIALTFFALGEGILLALAIEENTRRTALMLDQQSGAGERAPAESPPAESA